MTLVRAGGEISGVKIEAPIKAGDLRVTTITRATEPGTFALLVVYAMTPGADAMEGLSESEQHRLEAVGLLVGPEQVSEVVRYDCDAEQITADLVPLRGRGPSPAPVPPATCAVNPSVQIIGLGGPSREMRGARRLNNPFREDRFWFSVDDAAAAPMFHSTSPAIGQHLEPLVSGAIAPAALPGDAFAAFRAAGVLRPAEEIAERRRRRDDRIAAAQRQLLGERCVMLDEVIQPAQLASIRQYYRQFLREGYVRFGDAEWPHRYFSSLDGLTQFFQQQLTGLISAIAGEPVKPSFAFFTSYHPGSDLPRHKDRAQCYLAMSVLLDHAQPDDISRWPIYIEPPRTGSARPIHCGLGDGLLYFGEEVPHYRHALTEGHSTLWFLFWVPENFTGSLD